ncbi:polysaccharide deacetylase family protein [Dactylosporangium sp. CA-139114]|uniref:polysaccharide deacetylase family protein n=1 Tax=Dactylosporangium sp. CA-139114 TaxID=3239931 RepID=UPI003D986DFC
MRYSGVAWNANGYEVEVIDADGRPVAGRARFDPGRTDDMIEHLRRLGTAVTVVDSTNGILDGRMMAAGLDVYRADPDILPPRPVFGSVPAAALAEAARRDLATVTRLGRTTGTQTGREHILEADAAASAHAVGDLVAAGRCHSHGPRSDAAPAVALTFDDGPLPPYTGQVLDVLRRYGVPATFFCVGMNAGAHDSLLARMRDEGHAVGNHTWSHPFLPELTQPQLIEQLERTDEAIAQACGESPALFRPPYGSRTPEVVGWMGGIDTTMVLWDVEPFDWAMPGADVIAERVLRDVRPGSIILLHDGGGDRSQVVAALPRIIEDLLARSYRFLPVAELVAAH